MSHIRYASYLAAEPPRAAWRCDAHGCEIHDEAELYVCHAKRCGNEVLCIGCVFTCASCGLDFCEQHTIDINRDTPAPWAQYLCHECNYERKEEEAA